MKARIKLTGQICQILCMERKTTGALYDLRYSGQVMRKIHESEIEILEDDIIEVVRDGK